MDSKDLELLQAIGDVIKNEMKDVKDRISGVENRIAGVENKLSDVEDRISGVENKLSDVEGRLSNVEHSVTIIEVEHGHKIGALYDGYLLQQEKFKKYVNLDERVENLEIDMSAVRMTLKNI